MSIDLYYDSDCPLAAGVRDELRSVLDEAGLGLRVAEQPPGRGCRTDRPSREQIRAALAGLGGQRYAGGEVLEAPKPSSPASRRE